MAINLNEWKQKYPDIEENMLLDWLSDLTIKGTSLNELPEEMKKKYNKHKGIEEPKPMPEPEPEPEPENAEESEPEEPDEIEDDFTEEKERYQSTDPPLPYDNPDISQFEVPEDEFEDEEPEEEPTIQKPRIKPPLPRQEMITKTITIQDYEEVMRPFKPIFDDIKNDPNMINKLASQIDGRYMPPYMQLKSTIINNPIKDVNNTKVEISVISEQNTKRIEPKYVSILEAFDITKLLADEEWWKESLINFDIIVNKLIEDRRALVSLVFILENYAEQKQTSPFEISIPKAALTESIQTSFATIKELITNNVIKEMGVLREDLQGEMIDVGSIVEKNMSRFDTQIQEAVTKVLWKVKTDVENTNMEDIRRTLLYILNKREAAYKLGAGALAIITVMLDDLEQRLMQTGYKLDSIKEHRIYTISELTKRLGYSKATTLTRAIPLLNNRKLIRLYKNGNISL